MTNRPRLIKTAVICLTVLVAIAALTMYEPVKAPQIAIMSDVNPEQIDWMEISPQMSATTYVDDASFIREVVALIQKAELRPATREEVSRMQTSEPPGDTTLNGSTYIRNIIIDFVQKIKENEESKVVTLASIHLYGDVIAVNSEYYTALSPLTDEFIIILDSIFSQGKGKTAAEIVLSTK
jgi:hypothetical protein